MLNGLVMTAGIDAAVTPSVATVSASAAATGRAGVDHDAPGRTLRAERRGVGRHARRRRRPRGGRRDRPPCPRCRHGRAPVECARRPRPIRRGVDDDEPGAHRGRSAVGAERARPPTWSARSWCPSRSCSGSTSRRARSAWERRRPVREPRGSRVVGVADGNVAYVYEDVRSDGSGGAAYVTQVLRAHRWRRPVEPRRGRRRGGRRGAAADGNRVVGDLGSASPPRAPAACSTPRRAPWSGTVHRR